jgi:hypothetical protein
MNCALRKMHCNDCYFSELNGCKVTTQTIAKELWKLRDPKKLFLL